MNQSPTVAPYGTWRSPITASMLTDKTVSFEEVAWSGENIVWIESHPEDSGRHVIMQQNVDGTTSEISPAPFNARTRVHEYGGGSIAADGEEIFFSHFGDHRLYRISHDHPAPQAVSAQDAVRFADLTIDRTRGQLIAVREDHRDPDRVINTIVKIPLNDPTTIGQVIVAGNDFYMFPRISPDGQWLAWIEWSHPNMPWDGTTLYRAPIGLDGLLGQKVLVAGGDEEAIFQPQWSPDNVLYFVSDRTGWWNLYRHREDRVTPITAMHAEFGVPAWVFGLSTYGFTRSNQILCTYSQNGYSHLALIDVDTSEMQHLSCPYSMISHLQVRGSRAVMIAAKEYEGSCVVRLDSESEQFDIVKKNVEVVLSEGDISRPQAVSYPTDNGLTAHAFYYPPQNANYLAPEGERPPLIVYTHGGPTGFSAPVFRLSLQYWTTRGFAVVDVNYGGSTGYGREYRNRLRNAWGITDIKDVVNAALYLSRHGQADENRLLIRGGSAGGYTTIAALTFTKAFRGGASYYGVSDLSALARETHKFESRYLDRLVGPFPASEAIYKERSPIFHVSQIQSPIIFFQGLDDHVVPPNQSELMVNSLQARKIPVAYLTFPGEGHGFVQAETLIRAQEAELYFYHKILGIPVSEPLTPVEIENLSSLGDSADR